MTISLGDLTQIPVSTRPTQGLPPLGDVTVTLYNQDITNVVYASYQAWFTPGATNCIAIQPLGSVTISAKKAVYVASSVSGVLPLLVLPEGSSVQPSPAQIAAQINALGLMKDTTGTAINANVTGVAKDATVSTVATNTTGVAKDATVNTVATNTTGVAKDATVNTVATNTTGVAKDATVAAQTTGATIATDVSNAGVPLLNKSTVILNSGSQVIAAGGSYTPAVLTMTKPTYEIYFTVISATATEAQPWLQVSLNWLDSATGTVIQQQRYIVSISNSGAGTQNYHAVGPIHGDQVQVSIQNKSAVQNATVTVLLLNNSRPANDEIWRQLSWNAVNGETLIGGADIQTGLLAQRQDTVGIGASLTRMVPFYTGNPVYLRANTASNTSDLEVRFNLPASLVTALAYPAETGGNTFYDFNSDSKGLIQQILNMPRTQMEIVYINHNAAAQSVTINMWIQL